MGKHPTYILAVQVGQMIMKREWLRRLRKKIKPSTWVPLSVSHARRKYEKKLLIAPFPVNLWFLACLVVQEYCKNILILIANWRSF